jgi:hypothetical protein
MLVARKSLFKNVRAACSALLWAPPWLRGRISLYANHIHDVLCETQACSVDHRGRRRYRQHIRQNKPTPASYARIPTASDIACRCRF